MAYQPKSYRKFLAGTVTAAVVASAVAPAASAAFTDVPATDTHAENIAKAVEAGFIKGYEDGSFKPYQTITRGQVAKILANVFGKGVDTSKTEPFADVTANHADKELYEKSLIVKELGIFGGSNGKLDPAKPITRQQMAKVLVAAFDLKDNGKKVELSDLDTAFADFRSDITILAQNEVTTVTKFNPLGDVTRGQFATFVMNAVKATENVVPTVTGVSAINATTLELKGSGLTGLKAEDIKLDGNTVVSVTPAKDGKSATVKFASAFLLDQKYKVEIKDSENTKSFEFSYNIEVNTVELVSETKDDDTIGQTVTVKVNGQPADYDTLAAAGYTVEFTAVNSSNAAATATFFKNVSSGVATTPVLNDTVALDDYTVEVTVRKDGSIVVADKGVVKVRNLELTTSAIEKEFYTSSNNAVAVQNSSTLVTGEALTLNKIRTVNNGVKTDVPYSATDILIQSSNPAVISVNGDTITANTPGTAVITVSYGDVEKKVTYTVTNTGRVLTKAVPSSSSMTIITGKSADMTITAVDQYGDYLNDTITVEAPANGIVTVGGAASTTVDTDDTNATGATTGTGDVTVAQAGAAFGTGTVLLKDSKGKTIGSFGVKTTAVDNTSIQKVELIKGLSRVDPLYSEDTTLDLAGDKYVGYAYNVYTSENVPNGNNDFSAGSYTVTYNSDVVVPAATLDANDLPATWAATAGTGQISKATIATEFLYFQAVGVGSTDVVIYDANGQKVTQFKLTVSNTDYKIQSVSFKQQSTIDYAGKKFVAGDFLTLVSSDNDDIVKGISLNKATTHVIRIAETAGATAAVGDLYIDVNGNGVQDAGEKVLGTAIISVVSGGKGTNFGTAADFKTGDLFISGTPAVTASGDEGTLVFKIVDSNDNSKVITSTSVNVKVK